MSVVAELSERGQRMRKPSALRFGLSKTGDQAHIRRAGFIAYCGKDLIGRLRAEPQADVVCQRCVQYHVKATAPPPPPKERKPRVKKEKVNWFKVTLKDGYTYRSMNKPDAWSIHQMHAGSDFDEVRYDDASE